MTLNVRILWSIPFGVFVRINRYQHILGLHTRSVHVTTTQWHLLRLAKIRKNAKVNVTR